MKFADTMLQISSCFKATLSFFIIGILCLSCISTGRYRGMVEQDLVQGGSTQAALRDSYGRKYLVAVGIDNYEQADNLRHAARDARSIVAHFRASGFETEELYDADATKPRIMGLVESTLRKAGPNDLVIVFFAGHGIDLKDADESIKGYLVPVEGKTKDAKSLVPMNWLQIDLLTDKSIRAKHLLFLLDACSSGIVAARATVNVDSTVRNYISELMKREARQVITAGTGNQQVLDGGYMGHSIFAGLVLQGLEDCAADLNGDYHITATELGLFLSQKVYTQSKGAQKPDFAKLLGTKGGEVILRFPNDREKQILEDRKKNAGVTTADLAVSARPVAADILVYDMAGKLVAEKRNIRDRTTIQNLPVGDYQLIVQSRDSRYDSVMMILGLYGPVAKDVTLPRKMLSVSSIPLL